MKIAYVLDDTLDKPDGVQQAMTTIAEHVRARGHDVHYIVPTTTRTDLQNIHCMSGFIQMKFNGNSVRTPKRASSAKISALMEAEKYDVIHVQLPYSPLMSAKVVDAAAVGTRIVGTFHILPYNAISRVGTKALGIALARNIRKFTKLYAVSPPALEFMKTSFGVSGSVLGNPVDYAFFNSFKTNNSQNDKKRIVFVGRFDERKGVTYLLQAYKAMKQRNNVELIMCGKGPLLEQVKTQVTTDNLTVTFPGFVTEEQKAQYLASADIAVFPSTGGESFGIVLTEAMSSGAGITIGGNNLGYASVLHDFPETLFDPKDIPAFATLLDKCVTDQAFATQIGTHQHEFVKRFDINKIVDTLLAEAYS